MATISPLSRAVIPPLDGPLPSSALPWEAGGGGSGNDFVTTSHILTEAGDALITEGGDHLILE